MTLDAAHVNRRDGIHHIVVAVGDWVDREELAGIASYPAENNLLHVDSTDDLAAIKTALFDQICNSTHASLNSNMFFSS